METKDPYGAIHRIQVDLDGNVRKVIHPEAYDSQSDDGAGITYQYDANQSLVKEMEPGGGIRQYQRDANGNLKKVIEPEAYANQGEAGEGMTYTYDSRNRLKTVRNPKGEVLRWLVYDKKGKSSKN